MSPFMLFIIMLIAGICFLVFGRKLDESNNIFNPISVEDLNEAQKDLKAKMYERAIDKGVLDIAKSNAETVLTGMLQSADGEYEIKIEWQ